ncbi:hypothetical protein Vadar_009220 [Vaccinium darrowii]|uniref:Uncharacterized protein n=1 Tax=Vaccinium darrowii TaxID=229202 RepID=A0ACB7XGQ1_9ERIC|nr:hypothetical protein Vadar_009220 [Vaccinium darrowii]
MGPGLKKRQVSSSVTGTTTPGTTTPIVAVATLAPDTVASTRLSTSPSTQMSGAGAPKRTRKRGPTLGKGVRKMIAHQGEKRLDVYVTQEMRALCGINATKVANVFGARIRHSCPIEGFYKSWRLVDSGLKGAIIQAIRDKFRIHEDGDEFTDLVDEVINEKATTIYAEWKHEMGKHYRLTNENYEKTKDARDHPYRHPYKGVNQDRWKYMVDHVFGDETWKKRSLAGKENRTKLPYNHTLGSRSLPAAMTIEADKNQENIPLEDRLPLVDRLPDFCDTYMASHTLKDTQDWIVPICKEKYDNMVILRDQAAQSGIPLTAEELSRVGLGERKNYIRGFGNGPKPSSYITKSKSDSARQGQLQKFQVEMDSIREEHRREKEEEKMRHEKEQEEARLREEEHMRRYEEVQRNNEAMRRELDEFRTCMMQFQNCGRGGTVGSQ